MGFLSPWFLLGLAAIGLPVYIHLLRRHIDSAAAIQFAHVFRAGHAKLHPPPAAALPAAVFAAHRTAAAAWCSRLPIPLSGGRSTGVNDKLLLVVVDNSFSMKAGSRFADAKQAALQLLASRPRSQRAEVMALGGRLAILTQPIQDAGALRSAVESIQPGDSRANLGELAHGVRALAETVRTPVELHLFSDMQKTGMPANFADMELPANVSVVLHPVGAAASPNWTVESVNAPAQLADPKDPKKSRVQAVIAGYETPAASRTVSLVVNGNTIATRKVEIPANGRATVEFQPLDVPYGLNRCADQDRFRRRLSRGRRKRVCGQAV